MIAPEFFGFTPVFRRGGLPKGCVWDLGAGGQLLPWDRKEKGVGELKGSHSNNSAPLPAKRVLHKGVQLTIGIKFNDGH